MTLATIFYAKALEIVWKVDIIRENHAMFVVVLWVEENWHNMRNY